MRSASTCGCARCSSIWSDFSKAAIHLRTVIVTAAVHRGFGSSLAALPLTFRHWAGVSPYTSTYVLAETCVFVKQSPGPAHCDPQPLLPRGHARSRVLLLPNVRSYTAEFLNEGSLVH